MFQASSFVSWMLTMAPPATTPHPEKVDLFRRVLIENNRWPQASIAATTLMTRQ